MVAKWRQSMSKTDRSEAARIADQLRRAFDGEAWHGDSLFEILEGVAAGRGGGRPLPGGANILGVAAGRAAARPIAGAHTIWELVLHVAAWDGAVLRRLGGAPVELSDAENFPPVRDTSEAAWRLALAQVRRGHEELVAAVASLPDSRLEGMGPGKEGAHSTSS